LHDPTGRPGLPLGSIGRIVRVKEERTLVWRYRAPWLDRVGNASPTRSQAEGCEEHAGEEN
jgi:hypothetical protein